MSDRVRACPSCGVDNPAERELCGRCGVDLATGSSLPSPMRREAPDPPRSEIRRVEHHRWLIPVAAVLAGAVLLVLGLTWAGFGPFADRPDVPPAEFDDARYPDEAAPLVLADVAAGSAEPGAAPSQMTDGDPRTAWRSAGTATGDPDVLEVIELGLRDAGWIDRLVLRNGDHADTEAYADSARIARVRLVTDAGEVVLADLLDLGLEAQELVFPEPLLATELRIEVLDVFPGSEDTLALAEIAVIGWSADAEDAALADERRRAVPPGINAPLGTFGSVGR